MFTFRNREQGKIMSLLRGVGTVLIGTVVVVFVVGALAFFGQHPDEAGSELAMVLHTVFGWGEQAVRVTLSFLSSLVN